MKHQYYGDVNDYRKYGLLRCLAQAGLGIGVLWMLTPDDGGGDGKRTEYLQSPGKWRGFDEDLFDCLERDLKADGGRNVSRIEASGLIDRALFCARLVPDDAAGRKQFFEEAAGCLGGCDLLFLDPDNGIEVPGVPYGGRRSSKYVYWRELKKAYDQGKSLLVYQHYPREERAKFHRRIAEDAAEFIPGATVYALKAKTVAYFLLARRDHLERVRAGLDLLREKWDGQLELVWPLSG